MTDVSEFLLARIGEDQDLAMRTEWPIVDFGTDENAAFGYRWDPIRFLAQCEAALRIVVRCQEMLTAAVPMAAHLAQQTLADMCRPYADHPDYREEWRL